MPDLLPIITPIFGIINEEKNEVAQEGPLVSVISNFIFFILFKGILDPPLASDIAHEIHDIYG
ncbi:hypothetical protein D3C73_1242000 [compost metagenome]